MFPDKIAEPIWLLLFFVPLLLLLRRRAGASMPISAAPLIGASRLKTAIARGLGTAQKICWLAVFCLLVVIAARPQHLTTTMYKEKEVKLISLCVDVSTSMSGEGITRIKEILDKFIRKRNGDYIAVTAYSGNSGREGGAGLLLPLTPNLLQARECVRAEIKSRMFGSFTALGEGVFASVISLIQDELEYLKSKGINLYSGKLRQALKNPDHPENRKYLDFFSHTIGKKNNKVIILFTDGIYNTGIHPVPVLDFAKRLGIRVYMVALRPRSATGTSQEEGMRRRLEIMRAAEKTGGRWFDGENYDEVEKIYQTINELEAGKILIKKLEDYEDGYGRFARLALLIFLVLTAIRYVWLKIP